MILKSKYKFDQNQIPIVKGESLFFIEFNGHKDDKDISEILKRHQSSVKLGVVCKGRSDDINEALKGYKVYEPRKPIDLLLKGFWNGPQRCVNWHQMRTPRGPVPKVASPIARNPRGRISTQMTVSMS